MVGNQWLEVPSVGRCGADRVCFHSKLGCCGACFFALLKAMFGDMQMETLADIIQTALMLRINERKG